MTSLILNGMARASGPQVKDIPTFRKSDTPGDVIVIPEVPFKRKLTDQRYLTVFVVVLLVSLPFLIYTLAYSDINRLINGRDSCGNVCGSMNPRTSKDPNCSGKDLTNEPLYESGECVSKCRDDRDEIFGFCVDKSEQVTSSKNSILAQMRQGAGKIASLSIIGLCFTVGMLFLYRYFMAVVVWIILIGSVLAFVALTIFFWIMSQNSEFQKNGSNPFQILAIAFTIISFIMIVVLICLFKRVKLVIRLFKESIKVIFGMPIILFEPFLTFVANFIMVAVFVSIFLRFATAGVHAENSFSNEYEPNGVMLFTFFYQGVLFLWFSQIIIGCQQMAISGAVSEYYFARDKDSLTLIGPIYRSLYNLVRYHLGTIIVGSLIIVLVNIVRALIRSLINNRLLRAVVDCCLAQVERFLKFLSKNAFILTAMHGQPFFKSGKRAVHLLAANALSVIAVNSVGDFVLFMTKLLICLATLFVGILMEDRNVATGVYPVAILVSVVITAIISDCFFTVFETTVDTILLCFCEDSLMNDGEENHYYMSVNLMQYIEESKKSLKPSQLR